MKRIIGMLICALIGGISAYYIQPHIADNTDVVLVVVTIFSVFAGFLIATITIIGDPIMIHEGSWRIAEAGRDDMRARLLWYIGLLFVDPCSVVRRRGVRKSPMSPKQAKNGCGMGLSVFWHYLIFAHVCPAALAVADAASKV